MPCSRIVQTLGTVYYHVTLDSYELAKISELMYSATQSAMSLSLQGRFKVLTIAGGYAAGGSQDGGHNFSLQIMLNSSPGNVAQSPFQTSRSVVFSPSKSPPASIEGTDRNPLVENTMLLCLGFLSLVNGESGGGGPMA